MRDEGEPKVNFPFASQMPYLQRKSHCLLSIDQRSYRVDELDANLFLPSLLELSLLILWLRYSVYAK